MDKTEIFKNKIYKYGPPLALKLVTNNKRNALYRGDVSNTVQDFVQNNVNLQVNSQVNEFVTTNLTTIIEESDVINENITNIVNQNLEVPPDLSIDTITLNGGTISDSSGTITLNDNTTVVGNFDINTNKFTVNGSSGNTSIAGTLGVTGNTSLNTVDISSTLGVDGNFDVNTNKFTVSGSSGNTSIAGTLGVTGNTSLSTVDISSTLGVDGNFDVNTNKFTIDSGSGNTSIAGTLSVNSDLTLNGSYLTLRANQSQANVLSFEKINTVSTIADGTAYGEINWNGYDGDEYVKGATIFARVDGSAGNNDMPSELVIGLTPDGSNTTTEYVNIKNDGEVNISGVLKATSATSSTNSSTGSIICSGGVGIAENLNVAGNFNVTGTISGGTSLTLDSTVITTAEIGVLDGVTAGTATASKALVLDANKDIGTIRNLSLNGAINLGSDAAGDMYYRNSSGVLARIAVGSNNQVLTLDGTVPGWENATGGGGSVSGDTYATDLKIGRDADNHIDFATTDNEISLHTNATERMVILSDGNVGIGTASPEEVLHVNGTIRIEGATGQFMVQHEDTDVTPRKEYIQFPHIDGNNDGAVIYCEGATGSGKLVLAIQDDISTTDAFIVRSETHTGSTNDIAFFRADGNVGIGTVTPSEKLDVDGVVECTSLTETSDSRIKFNKHNINNALKIINKLEPKYYEKILENSQNISIKSDEEWNIEKNKWKYHLESGLIAQDVKKIPELNHCVIENEGKLMKLNYSNIFTYNIAATKELTTLLNIEKAKVTELETKVSNLETQIELIKKHLNLG